MSGGEYLAAAYLVFIAVVVVYVVLIALKLGRLERDLEALAKRARTSRGTGDGMPNAASQSFDGALARRGEGRSG